MRKKSYEHIIRSYGETGKLVCGDLVFSDNRKYADACGYKGFERWKYFLKIRRGYFHASWKLFLAIFFKRCYYGPFKGEFGNFLGHNLPFLAYLHSKGVKIYYCGMLLHKSFLVDENGKSIIYKWYGLRDFFKEVSPQQNITIPPADVQIEIDKFEKEAKSSIFPFFNIGDPYYYWFIHRTWMLKGFMKTIDFGKIYKSKKKNSVVIFPRSKGSKSTSNNGYPWDWEEVVQTVKPYFEKVYVLGHPAFSSAIQSHENVEVIITDDNSKIIEKCCNSNLIITQHSGTCYLGEYTNTQVLIIFKGKFPIVGINDSIVFKEFIGKKYPFEFAFSLQEIEEYVKNFPSFRQKL
ncbi:MAG: hypothetical protein HY841_05155 [Bacteroidetes bacterium]|nr:hypothetical protein [Bacteroidota bacterium]